jgi:monovalent cation/hydrogen antiporter
VGREVHLARTHAYRASLAAIDGDDSATARMLRKSYAAMVELNGDGEQHDHSLDERSGGPVRRRAISAARECTLRLRNDGVIGDAAFRVVVQELDWMELSAGARERRGSSQERVRTLTGLPCPDVRYRR